MEIIFMIFLVLTKPIAYHSYVLKTTQKLYKADVTDCFTFLKSKTCEESNNNEKDLNDESSIN